jgi:hypothetical protein
LEEVRVVEQPTVKLDNQGEAEAEAEHTLDHLQEQAHSPLRIQEALMLPNMVIQVMPMPVLTVPLAAVVALADREVQTWAT